MKKFLLIIFLCLYSTILFANPAITFAKLEHDFGTIKQKTIVKEIFTFKNTGDSTLDITKIETSCGCTGTLLSKKEIPAGEDGNIEISFNSGTYNGKITKHIYIYTNDPANKEVVLKISAIVEP